MKTICIFALLTLGLIQLSAQKVTVRVNGASSGRVFEGVGAVSAGASSRLLPDYPEPAKSYILDYLFTPKFGASFQHLKVEIGGGENSTCGSEPSHAYTKEELTKPVERGYELWFANEAHKRNPKIILDCLPWSFPGFLSAKFNQNSADWFTAFLDLAREKYGLHIDWLAGAQNETSTDLDWISNILRPTLDRRGYKDVKIQAPEFSNRHWNIFDDFDSHPEAVKDVEAVSYHYVSGREPWTVDLVGYPATEKAKNSGKPLWASEEYSTEGGKWDPQGALYIARLINKVYLRDRITKTEFWSPFDGIYKTLAWEDAGFLQADQPWSGHYEIWPALWAVAHTTQFTEPGWRYLDSSSGRFSDSTWNGSYVTLRSVTGKDWSMIITTDKAVEMKVEINGGLNSGPIHVWKSNEREQFIEQTPITPKKAILTIALDPNSIYTLTTTTGQRKGSHPIPTASAFPFPYHEDFESYSAGSTPKYFSDQKGTFEVADIPNYGKCLRQIVTIPGYTWEWGGKITKPYSVIGNSEWSDYTISSDVFIEASDVEIGGRFMARLSYRFILDKTGAWSLLYQDRRLASGWIEIFDASFWHHMSLSFLGDNITATLDGKQLAKVTDNTTKSGMAYIVSSYYQNMFDNVTIDAQGSH